MASLSAFEFAVFLHVLGAALWVGGTAGILSLNRALKGRLPDEVRRDVIRLNGRVAGPVLAAALALAVASGWWLASERGIPLNHDLIEAKGALVILSAAALTGHILIGRKRRRDTATGPDARRAAKPAHTALNITLGLSLVAAGLGLLYLGARLRWA